MEFLALLLIIGLLALVWFTYKRKLHRGSQRSADAPLLAACMGDSNKAERLKAYEKRNAPTPISDQEAARRALERLESERR